MVVAVVAVVVVGVVVVEVVGGGGGGGVVVVGPGVDDGEGAVEGKGSEGKGSDVGCESVTVVVSSLKTLVAIASGCRAGVLVPCRRLESPDGPSVVVLVAGIVVDVLVGVVDWGVKIGATAMSRSSLPLSMVKGNTARTTTAMPAPTRATTRSRSWASAPSSLAWPRVGRPLDESAMTARRSVYRVVSQ